MPSGLWLTPLARLKSLSTSEVEAWSKLKFSNALSHSIKDRPVWYMVVKAIEEGKLGKILYEALSGNVAVALAVISKILGVRARLYIPKPTPKITKAFWLRFLVVCRCG